MHQLVSEINLSWFCFSSYLRTQHCSQSVSVALSAFRDLRLSWSILLLNCSNQAVSLAMSRLCGRNMPRNLPLKVRLVTWHAPCLLLGLRTGVFPSFENKGVGGGRYHPLLKARATEAVVNRSLGGQIRMKLHWMTSVYVHIYIYGKEKRGKSIDGREERYHHLLDQVLRWWLWFWCLLVKGMVAVLIHLRWGKPMKHRIQ